MAICGIMRIEKRRRGAVYGLQIEANRTQEDHNRGRDFDRSDVDWERTADNVHLVHTDNWNKEITRQIHGAGLTERKNSTVMLDGLYTASAEWFAEHTHQEAEQYFRECLAFHVREFCGGDESRVINAVVHLDEATPHMQVASVPIIKDEKGMHLSAKIICGGKADFRKHQDHFFEQVAQSHGLGRGEVRNDAALKRHITKREWQIATQDERLKEQKEQLLAAQNIIKRAQDAELLVQALDNAQSSPQIVQKARRTHLSKDLKITPSDLQTLALRASMGEELQKTLSEIVEHENAVRKERREAEADRKAAEDEWTAAERIRSGQEYQIQSKKLDDVINQYNETITEYNKLANDNRSLKQDVYSLKQDKAELSQDVERIRNEQYMRQFCRQHQQEFDEFVREERSQEWDMEL